ncbi:LysR substrate-binding domain-containing protein [Oxalobacteraceae bacterium A2-2]
MFELSQLRCFVTIAEEAHFGRAAERLGMTQPPLSRQIHLLEHQVGALLLERSSRGVRLTRSAVVFLKKAVCILRAAEDATLMVRQAGKGEHGNLVIGFTAGTAYSLLPRIVRQLRQLMPGLSLKLVEMISTAQLDAINAGDIDLGLMRPLPLHAELHSAVLATEALMLATPEAEAAAWPAVPALTDLHDKAFIMYSPYEARPFYQMLNERFAQAGVMPRVVEHVGQVHAMLALVAAGLGVTLDVGLMRPHAINSELDTVPIATESLVLVIPETQSQAWPPERTLDCLHGRPFIMYSPDEARPFYLMLNERFSRAGVAPDVVQHIGQVHTMLGLVRIGMGAALIAESAARYMPEGLVVRRMMTEPVQTVCTYRRDNLNPVLRLFLREVIPTFQLD